jgi:hypothetical protein
MRTSAIKAKAKKRPSEHVAQGVEAADALAETFEPPVCADGLERDSPLFGG